MTCSPVPAPAVRSADHVVTATTIRVPAAVPALAPLPAEHTS